MELLIIKQNEWLQLNETIQHNQAMQTNHPKKTVKLHQTNRKENQAHSAKCNTIKAKVN